MREAELPDGTILEFPDETPDEVMDRVVKENIFQQQNAAPPDSMGFGAPAEREAMQPETPELRRDIDVAKAQAGFEALPTWQKPFRAAADVASVYGAGATLGFSDHLAALASGKTVDEERAITQQARDRMGWAAPVAEIGGAISSIPAKGIGLVRNIPALTSASGRLARAGNTAARTGAFAAEGAALGTAGAIGYGNDPTTGAAVGAALGPVGQAVGAAAGKVGGVLGRKPDLVEPNAIKDAARAAYQRSEEAGVFVKPSWTNELARDIRDGLREWGWRPKLAPGVVAVLDELDEMLPQNVTLKGVDGLRQVAGLLGKSEKPAERALSTQIIKKIDKHVDRMDMSHVVPGIGNKTEAVGALKDARRLWHTARKSEVVEEAMQKAELQAATAGTGGNLQNAMKQQFKHIVNSPRKRRGFSTEEIEAMRKIAMGSFTEDALRLVGRFSPTTGALTAIFHAGAAPLTGGLSMGVGAAGMASKFAAERMVKNNVYGLARLIRERGLTPDLAAQVKKMPRARRQRLNRVLQGWNVTGAEVEP